MKTIFVIMVRFTLILLAFVFSGCSVIIPFPLPKKAFEKNKQLAPYDAIIVPGVPYDGEHWSATMQIRVHWSNYLYQQGYTKNIIYSGGAVYSKYFESKTMALFGEGLSIPTEHIFVDTLAKHSTENVYYSLQIAKENGFKKVALATDPFQTKNLRKFIKKFELPVKMMPIVIDTLITIDKYEPKIDPSSAISNQFSSIEENESLLKRLGGTLGQQIIWREDDLKKKRFVRRFKRQGRLISTQ